MKHQEAAGLAALAKQLVADARVWAKAEVAFYRTVAKDRAEDAKMAAAYGIMAAVLANAALVALLVGLIISLIPLLGAFWSTIVVIAFTLAIAALLVRMALGHVSRMRRDRSSDGGSL